MKNRYWLFEKDGARGSLMAANYDVEYLIKDHPEYYEVSAFWYYANKLWRGLTPRAADLAVREPNSLCRNCGMGVYCEECDNTPNR